MNYFKKNIEQFKKDLSKLISFKTVLNEVYPNEEMKKALSYMGELAKRDGLEYHIDSEGYYGWIQIGKGNELIGILTHIDVVPEGDENEWSTPPFNLTEIDNKLYGRGTQDDKGPLMLMYYLLLEFKDKPLNKRIRLIFPTDEESKWRGVAKYKENEELPSYGFTPDSQFPVTFLEREIVQIELIGEGTNDFTLTAGTAANVVPAKAIYKTSDKEIIIDGLSSHAMDPSSGENAITKMIGNLPNLKFPIINFIRDKINNELNGKTLFGKLIKDDYAEITVNLAIAEINSEKSRLVLDSRIPITSDANEILSIYKEHGKEYGFDAKIIKSSPRVYVPEDNWLVKDLIDSYTNAIGEYLNPTAAGGGTYAKSMDNILAYGPLMPWSEHTMHQYNEYIDLNDYEKAYNVYVFLLNKWVM